MADEELAGGNMSAGVVRVGDTVRRPIHPWTPTIHRVLAHAHQSQLPWLPRVHGFDDEGREILEFIDGDVGHGDPGWIRTSDVLNDVGRALREWHDATASYAIWDDDEWYFPPREPIETICHGDFAPYNHVFRSGQFVGAFDFDLCTPGPRLWDIAYTAYRYVPLTPPVGSEVDDGLGADRSPYSIAAGRERLDAFLAAYGPLERDGIERRFSADEVLAAVPARLDAVADWCAEQDSTDMQSNGVMYRAHARWIEAGAFSPLTGH